MTLARVPDEPDPGVIYARKEEPEIEQREAAEEEVAELLALATRVEGIVRNVGMHAGGVLIAPGKITDFCPLYQQPGSDCAVSQFDKDDVEAIGLVKFDFLGLATLTILELAKTMVRARRPGREQFDYDQLPLDDAATYRLFADGQTEAVFQFESRGMQGMLRDAKPSRLEDLIALNAMFRPGPMENIPMLLRAQARPRADRLSAPAARAGAVGDLRHHGLPGAGDAGRAGAGRLLARRRRPAAPRDGQEEARGDGAAAPDLPRRRGAARASARPRPTRSST